MKAGNTPGKIKLPHYLQHNFTTPTAVGSPGQAYNVKKWNTEATDKKLELISTAIVAKIV